VEYFNGWGFALGPRADHVVRPESAMTKLLAAATATWLISASVISAQLTVSPSAMRAHPNINYMTAPTTDLVAQLNARLKSGETTLTAEPTNGYLRSVLKALNVPEESQILVFSKTSFQAVRIGPKNPRAIYFNDSVAVGWVRTGDVLEFASHDPTQGTVFYTLAQPGTGPMEFRRNNSACVQCHSSEATMYVPGMFIGSVFPEKDGMPAYGPAYLTDHRTPFELRWGGWYVTGDHSGQHLGNAVVTDPSDLAAMATPETAHVKSLAGRFDMDGYLSANSDIVALLVLEHQTHMLNLITRIGWEARMGSEAGRSLESTAAELVDYMLFVDEATLPDHVAGSTKFAEVFAAKGVRDTKGRSLRDLSLRGRLMKYPCSYLIYDPSFDALPETAKSEIYQRLWEVLSGNDTSARYERLTEVDRRAVVEILRATKKDLPDYFFPQPSGS
jgi:hypothetical protein